jgi:hypothetical protein
MRLEDLLQTGLPARDDVRPWMLWLPAVTSPRLPARPTSKAHNDH